MKVFITGQSGAGKTTLLKELQRRGYTAYNTDDISEATRLEHKASGKPADWPNGYVDWSQYAWRWQPAKIKELLAGDELVFIGAIVSNWADLIDLFDAFFVLTLSEAVLARRLADIGRHEHPQHPDNIRKSVGSLQRHTSEFIAAGAMPLDSNRPVEEIADELLANL